MSAFEIDDQDSTGLENLFQKPSDDAETILAVREVSVLFGGIRALIGMSFEVRQGELVAVIGPNGAGKTTLLNTICGLSKSNMTGDAQFQGTSIPSWRPSAIAAAGVGRSFQHPPLLEHETVVEN